MRCSTGAVSPAVQRSLQLSLNLWEPGRSAVTPPAPSNLTARVLSARWVVVYAVSLCHKTCPTFATAIVGQQDESVCQESWHACHFTGRLTEGHTTLSLLPDLLPEDKHGHTHTHTNVNNTRVNRAGTSVSDWLTAWLDDRPGLRKLCVTPHSYNLQLSHQTLAPVFLRL